MVLEDLEHHDAPEIGDLEVKGHHASWTHERDGCVGLGVGDGGAEKLKIGMVVEVCNVRRVTLKQYMRGIIK